jgi:hypothetical protein
LEHWKSDDNNVVDHHGLAIDMGKLVKMKFWEHPHLKQHVGQIFHK